MRHFYLLIFILLLLGSCNRKATLQQTIRPDQLPKEDQSVDIRIIKPDLTPIPQEKAELIYYGKTSCHGKCPVFFIQFYSDGSVVYTGIKNVPKLGQIVTQIPVKQLFQIINDIEQERFFQLAPAYPLNGQQITELPNTIIRINNRETTHTVIHNYDAPNAFYEIESRILGFLEQNFVTE